MNKWVNGKIVEMTAEEIAEMQRYEEEKYNGLSYDDLVSMFIRERYSQDNVEAIINNYLSNPEKHKAEFDEMQAYRLGCKERAREIKGIS